MSNNIDSSSNLLVEETSLQDNTTTAEQLDPSQNITLEETVRDPVDVLLDDVLASVTTWQSVDIKSLLPLLDEQCLAMTERKQNYIQRRKELINKVKKFNSNFDFL